MNSPQPKNEGWLYGLAFLVALAFRLLQLGAAPLNDSEATLALQAMHLAQGRSVLDKTTRAFLKRVDAVVLLAQPLQAIDIRELPRPAKGAQPAPTLIDLAPLLAPALAGADIGLISEAGLPAVADAGSALVASAHRIGIAVRPLPGPSSLMLALAASGLNGQSFAFVGYLPTDAAARTARLHALQQQSRRERQTQLAIETPYRNATLMAALLRALHPDTQLSVACGLTLPGGWCATRNVSAWRADPPTFDDKHLPAVFLWLSH